MTVSSLLPQQLEVPQRLYEAATDCICSALYVCEEQPKFYALALALKSHVEQLLPLYKAAVLSECTDRWAQGACVW